MAAPATTLIAVGGSAAIGLVLAVSLMAPTADAGPVEPTAQKPIVVAESAKPSRPEPRAWVDPVRPVKASPALEGDAPGNEASASETAKSTDASRAETADAPVEADGKTKGQASVEGKGQGSVAAAPVVRARPEKSRQASRTRHPRPATVARQADTPRERIASPPPPYAQEGYAFRVEQDARPVAYPGRGYATPYGDRYLEAPNPYAARRPHPVEVEARMAPRRYPPQAGVIQLLQDPGGRY